MELGESLLVFGVILGGAVLLAIACRLAWAYPLLGLGASAAAVWQAYEQQPRACRPWMELVCTPKLDIVICVSFVVAAVALATTAIVALCRRSVRDQLPRAIVR